MKKSVIQDKANLSPAKRLLLEKRLRGEYAVDSKVRLPLRPMLRPEAIPLSFAQKRLWFLHKLEGPSPTYNIRLAQRLEGKLNETALKAALHDVITRHESLRTIFPDTGDLSHQEILDAETIHLDLPVQKVEEAELPSCLDKADRHCFNLTCEIPLRVWLFRVAPEQHVLLLLLHHITCDGGSIAPLWRDLTEAYGARARGESPNWRPLTVQYADYALWQQELLGDEADASSTIARQLAHWRQTLAGLPEELDVPKDRLRPAVSSYRGESIRLRIDPELHQKLLRLARDAQASLYMVLQAGLAALLTRLGAGTDIPLGSAIEGRTDTALNQLVGFFVNTVVLRTETSGNPSFRELLARVREHDLTAYAHQDMPFERLVEVLNPMRSLNRHPLFQVMLNLQNNEAASFELPGLKAIPEAVGALPVKFDLSFNLVEQRAAGGLPQGIGGNIRYAADLFDRGTVEGMGKRLVRMLEAAAANPQQAIGNVYLLEPEERQQILHEWNNTKSKLPIERCVHELFEEQARISPDAVAVVCEDKKLSYEELNRRANQLAHFLRGMGVGPEARVALLLERSLEMVIGLMGVLKAGGAYVPLDSSYPAERVGYMLEDVQATVVLTHEKLREGLLRGQARVISLDSEWEQIAEKSEENLEKQVRPENLAYVIYTSGSTGLPKGVCIEHRHISNYVAAIWDKLRLSERLSFGLVSTIAADLGNTVLFPCLTHGGTLHVLTRDETTDSDRFASCCREHPLDCLKITPSHFQALLAEDRDPQRIPRQRLIFGGESLSRDLLATVRSLRPECRIYNHYGPTECSVGVLSEDVTSYDRFSPNGAIPLGRPMNNMSIYVLDSQQDLVPAGVPGEIFIGGQGVGRGYFCHPALTAQLFLPNPFSEEPGTRMYKTGDLGRWLQDGTIEFLGRNDFQVKVRGFRVELGEIEARLEKHDGIREAVVVAREDALGDKRLVAYYTCANTCGPGDETMGADVLRRHLASQLPEYMVPAAYVRMELLPLTANGKLDRKALPAPEGDAYATREYEAPQGEMETALAAIWAELLKLDQVGRHDNFFELGGHSLLAVRVVSRIRQVLRVEVAIRDLFARPVLADFARCAESSARPVLPPITQADRMGQLPLSFAQQRLWLLAQMEGVSRAYHIPIGLHLQGKLDRAALRCALDRIIARHEALRTTFIQLDGELVQRILSKENRFQLLEYDLCQHSDAQGELERLIGQEATTTFDMEHGPLVRGRLIRQAEDRHALLITMHHIVSDGWSKGVLLHELSTLYGAFRQSEADPLPELRVQYADYAVWQRKWVTGGLLQQQADYWKATLAGAPALLELPADHARPAQQNYVGRFVELVLEEKLSAGLKELSRRHGTTLFMTLLAGWAALLGRLSGQEEVVIGTPVANRGQAEIENLIGFFVNTLVLRVNLSSSSKVSELLAKVKEQALAAQQHQDIPFEQVVELARPERSLAHSALFQVMLMWQNTPEARLELPGVEVRPLKAPHAVAKFDLTLSLRQAGQSIVGGLEYASALFEPATIERYLGYLRSLLQEMVADETQTVDRLAILPAAERQQVLYEWNATATEYAGEQCVHELFEAQVKKTPQAVALVYEGSELTYRELNRRANQLAHYLRGLGVKPETRVAICVDRGLEMMVGLLAILKAGGAYVPLDPAYPVERLRYMLEDSAPRVLLTQGHVLRLFSGLRDSLAVIDLGVEATPWRDQPETNPDRESTGLTFEHLAYIIYTSGSTGQPKGVMIPHSALENFLKSMRQELEDGPDDVWLAITTLSFDIAGLELYLPLTRGARVQIVDREVSMDGARLLKQLRHVTTLQATPSSWRILLEAGWEGTAGLKVLCGGEALRADLAGELFARSASVWNMYGPTETTIWSAMYRLRQVEKRVPIGRPIANTRVYILDGQGQPAPVGVAGEIYIGGAGVARGYLKRPQLTAERFLPDAFAGESGARIYKTGDLGRWLTDGTIECLGRNDFQMKIRGFRIELGEIEARLAECAGVREAIVLAREDTPGDKRLVVYYTCADKADGKSDLDETLPGAEVLRSHLSASLPEYMVPAAYVRLESLPLTSNGKLDRKALPAPAGAAYAVRGYEAPRGETETKLASIWAEVLKLERVGRHDNFFELGGHSLLAMRVTSRLRQTLSLELALGDFFIYPVLADFAARILDIQLEQFDSEDIASVLTLIHSRSEGS